MLTVKGNMTTEEENKKSTKKSDLWAKISFWVMIAGAVLIIALGLSLLYAGFQFFVNNNPFIDSVIYAAISIGKYILYILSPVFLVAAIVIIELLLVLFKEAFDSHPIICIVLFFALLFAIPAGTSAVKHYRSSDGSYHSGDNGSSNSSESGEHFWSKWKFGKSDSREWDYFEEINRIGDSYSDICSDYSTLTESGNDSGGVMLKASESLYYSFPAVTKSDISNSDSCTGMTGTSEEMFGYDEDVPVSRFKEDLKLTAESEYEGNPTYKKTASSGYYYVVILSVDITNDSDIITKDTWISIIQRNREIVPVGELASDQSGAEDTVYYVEEGDRYHSDPSCSTLQNSDVIYECYIEDVPGGRTSCGVCY